MGNTDKNEWTLKKSLDQMKFEKPREEHTLEENVLETLYKADSGIILLRKIKLYLQVIMWILIIYVILSILQGIYVAFFI